ncbi:zinc-binding oxidoreductase CipB [Stachybotrys elegans]|uniref:Zinc-binding oxidoreductase CipB n=1 Tax=Stachybotrys elegans TaxID=80388 RepID=A0A8K0WRP2_9HYPO|nr:zinc-binding oxidoreductase CipB [Stachybotrys elegans]
MSSNMAAWITSPKAWPFEIKPAPMGVPGDDEILIRNHAIAMNPIDKKLQQLALYPLEYPAILGEDVAGEVVSVGPNVTRFRPGDRVVGATAGFVTRRTTDQAFQMYCILRTNLTIPLPGSMPFERAVVVPLGAATAAAGLFQAEFLNLQLPTHPKQGPNGKTVLVWGGASSVGSNAIQLAVAAGYEVFTTASPRNFDYVKNLGAAQAFDYSSPGIVQDLVGALQGKDFVGVFDAFGGPKTLPAVEVVHKTEGVKFVATTQPRFPAPPEGVQMKQVQAMGILNNDVGRFIFEDYLPEAFEQGTFVPSPEPLVAGQGLESIQSALDLMAEGVSARKIVVTL